MYDKPETHLHLTPTTSSSSSGSSSSSAPSRIFSGSNLQRSNSATSSPTILPTGNICRNGRVGQIRSSSSSSSSSSSILRSGSGNYGHGSVVRGALEHSAEEVKGMGNEMYKKGQFSEALKMYEKAISMFPENAAYRTNRAAALAAVGRVGEAVEECREALRFDSGFFRAHQRLASLYLRFGLVEHAQKQLLLSGQHSDSKELQKLLALESHLSKLADARMFKDWKSALREADSAIEAGADSSSLLISSRAEAFLRLNHLDEANSAISKAIKLDNLSPPSLHSKFFGMLSNSFMHIVCAQVEMALGRFENAVSAAVKAKAIDSRNAEVTKVLCNVRLVAKARAQGNEFFNLGKFDEACIQYGKGLMHDPSNPVLYCNRAACRSKLGQWERSIEDCNQALKIKPNYTKALLRRAESNSKLERWADSVRDYEVLSNELPGDANVAEALSRAQISLKKLRREEISDSVNLEVITGLDQLRSAITVPGICLVHFMVETNQHCVELTPFVDILRNRYTSVHFLKVDVNEVPAVCKAENVMAVPTFKIYRNGIRVKEMICPSHQMLEFSVRHYGL